MKNTDIRIKLLNTIILAENSTHEQKLQAIDILKNIDFKICLATVETSYINQSAKNMNSDNINKALRIA